MNSSYSTYGSGSKILVAFHGYGMDGNQFQILEKSLCASYRVIGFHLPYHKNGLNAHEGWLESLVVEIEAVLAGLNVVRFSIAGYSIGAKVALYLMHSFKDRIDRMYLFAPYGIENHWGLRFVTQGIGNRFFQSILKTTLPIHIMRLIRNLRIIDESHFQIILKEMDTQRKRTSLCKTLHLAGMIRINKKALVKNLNERNIQTDIIYGQSDVLFPFNKRNERLLTQLHQNSTHMVSEGHWMITKKLDDILFRKEVKS